MDVAGDRRDAVVVGAGIAGASVALHLAAAGASVAVVDDGRAGRATLAGAGIVSAPWKESRTPLWELRSRSVEAYAALAAGSAGHRVVGELHVAPAGPALDAVLTALDAAGLRPEALDDAGALDAFPLLAGGLAAARVPGTARVDGEGLRISLLERAAAAGAVVTRGPAALVPPGARGRAPVVAAGGVRMSAEAVVVAAGAWTDQLLAPLGAAVGVVPQRGQIVHLDVGQETADLPVVSPVGADHYLLAFPDRRVVVGATRETGGGWAADPTASGVASVLARALGVAPGLGAARLREVRVGLRPATADGLPLLGAVPGCPGVWAATGMGPQGLTLGPYCGRLVADAVLGRVPELDLSPFAPGRGTP